MTSIKHFMLRSSLLGHGPNSHFVISAVSPSFCSLHVLPPKSDFGDEQYRFRLFFPSPHVLEHSPQADHLVNLPSTTR